MEQTKEKTRMLMKPNEPKTKCMDNIHVTPEKVTHVGKDRT